jgi:tetratricopeptide (TPR) repeat protein
VLANDPRNVKAWTRKCSTFFQQRDDISAREACEQAVELDNTYPDAFKQLGMVRYTSRNYEGAIEAFQTCIRLMDAQGWSMSDRLGECYTYQGLAWYLLDDCTTAMPLFREALKTELGDLLQGFTYTGMNSCAAVDDTITLDDIPTPAPPTPVPPEPIGIF